MKYYLMIVVSIFAVMGCRGMITEADLELGREIENLVDHVNVLLRTCDNPVRHISVQDFITYVGISESDWDSCRFIEAQLTNLDVVQYNHIYEKINYNQMEQADAQATLFMALMRASDMQNKLKDSNNQQLADALAHRNKKVKAASIFSAIALIWALSATIWAVANEHAC